MARPCLESGCRQLARGDARCPEHKRAEQRRIDARRGSPLQRGYDAEYRRNRQAVLAASGGICAYCRRGPGLRDPITVDHVVPRTMGGTNAIDNLVACHRSCNSRKGGASRWGR